MSTRHQKIALVVAPASDFSQLRCEDPDLSTSNGLSIADTLSKSIIQSQSRQSRTLISKQESLLSTKLAHTHAHKHKKSPLDLWPRLHGATRFTIIFFLSFFACHEVGKHLARYIPSCQPNPYQISLIMLHPQNPPNRKTQIPGYKFKLIQNLT